MQQLNDDLQASREEAQQVREERDALSAALSEERRLREEEQGQLAQIQQILEMDGVEEEGADVPECKQE